jgi:hypothetical protein
MRWTIENDILYGMYVRADKIDEILIEAIQNFLDTPNPRTDGEAKDLHGWYR